MNHSHFSSNDPNGSDQNNSSAHQYEYIFTHDSGTAQPQQPHAKKPMSSLLKRVLTVGICAVVSFGAAFGGAVAANRLGLIGADEKNTDTENNLLHSDPEAILDKKESTPSVYGSAGENVLGISQVVQKVEDSIVVIQSTVMTSSIFGGTQESVSAGSGVIIDESGYILTCNHVVENATKIRVTVSSDTVYDATLVGGDSASDIAVLKITPKKNDVLTAVKQGCSADLVVGEYVIAIGNPLGTLSGTVTSGIISATERSITVSDGTVITLLQTDAAINSGNSGGGLFNLQGELIGIVNAKYASSGVEGLAFAIPIDSAYEVQKDLIEYGFVRGVVDTGLSTIDVTEAMLRQSASYYYKHGVYSAGVYVTESSFQEELKNADRIISINGAAVNSTAALKEEIKRYRVGDTISIRASRAGEEFTVSMELREYVPQNYTNTEG